MKAALIIIIIIYWIIIGIVFAPQLDSPLLDQGFTGNQNITDYVDTETEPTGFVITDIWRLLGIIFLGIGLPASVPVWISLPFIFWQFGVSIIFIIGLIA